MSRSRVACRLGLVVVACGLSSCAPVVQANHRHERAARAPMLELWKNPTDLAQRDLRWGPGRPASAPAANAVYTVIKRDDTGFSRGYDVVGPDKRKWSIKVGKEAQPEIVLSRVLWALGYHQPETYYVKGWQLAGDFEFEGQPARFRLQSDHQANGEWKWVDNPFAGSTPMHGLIAINLLFNNWDLKTSNNRVYRLEGSRSEPAHRYVVQDLGASLGRPRVFPAIGTRNDLEDFETTPLIKQVRESDVVLNYRGRHGEILDRLSIDDLIWACELLNRLSDAQFDQAFRAAEYPADVRQRYIKKIRDKIHEALALRPLVARAGERR